VLITAYTVTADFYPGSLDAQPTSIQVLGITAALAFVGTFVPAIVVYCVWLHRIVRNMPALGAADPRWSPGGAVGRCFVPIFSFVHPLFSVLDAWRGSDPGRRWLDVAARRAIPAPRLMVAWWVLWLASEWGGNVLNWTGTVGAVLDTLRGTAFVGAAVLAILVVRKVTVRQDRKHELISSGQLA
jgi:hypothetical protein